MKAGRLRHRCTIETRKEVQKPSGAVEWKYIPWASDVPFEIVDMSTRERFAAQQVQSTVNTRLRIRWRPGVTAKMRVKHVPDPSFPKVIDYYDIEGVTRDPTLRRMLQLVCTKRDAEGFRSGESI